MVNCKKCGAPLSLNDAFCPYCGEANPEAQEHLKKLQELDEQFESASREVAAEVKYSKKGYGILVILVMFLLANLVIFVMHQMSYGIAERITAGKMPENEIKAQLDQFLEDGEYIELDLFMSKFSLSYRDYEDYSKIQLVLGDNAKVGDNKQYQFIRDEEMVVNDVFAGVPDIEPETRYSIQTAAFTKIESYKLIGKGL